MILRSRLPAGNQALSCLAKFPVVHRRSRQLLGQAASLLEPPA